MRQILDRAVLLIFCICSALFCEMGVWFLVAFLVTSSYASLHYCIRRREYRLTLSLCYFALLFLRWEFALFIPLALYCVTMDEYRFPAILPGVLALRLSVLPGHSWGLFSFTLTGMALALLLARHTLSYLSLEKKFKLIRDNEVERNLLLEEKNRALLEKQDYEIYTATLRERNRIAREIHDHVGHMLSRSILLTGAAKTVNRDLALAPSLELLEDTLHAAMTNIRESVHDLHDESLNLKDTVESLAAAFAFCPVSLEYDMGFDIPKPVKYCFIAVVKESLHNVSRHSDADKVNITLREHPALYQLVIEDNGTKSASKENSPGNGLGLRNMQDRVRSLGGRMQIQTEKGFRIFITIQKKEDF